MNKERKLNWLSDYPDLDTNYKVYKKLLNLQPEDYKGFFPVKYFERTLGYVLIFKNDDKFYVMDTNDQLKKYELHIHINTICPLSGGETDAGISIHFCD